MAVEGFVGARVSPEGLLMALLGSNLMSVEAGDTGRCWRAWDHQRLPRNRHSEALLSNHYSGGEQPRRLPAINWRSWVREPVALQADRIVCTNKLHSEDHLLSGADRNGPKRIDDLPRQSERDCEPYPSPQSSWEGI